MSRWAPAANTGSSFPVDLAGTARIFADLSPFGFKRPVDLALNVPAIYVFILAMCHKLRFPVLVSFLFGALLGLASADELIPHPDSPWIPVGETITYKLYWGLLPVATSTATTEWVDYDGKQRIAIRIRTRSNSVIEKLYPVDDFIESIVDPDTLLPLRFTKKLSEGRYRANETTVFDREKCMAYLTKVKKDGGIRNKEYAITEDTRDLLSFMYFMRSQPLEVGENSRLEVMADEKLYDLLLNVPRMQNVSLDKFGNISAIRVEPKAKFQGLFVRKGEMTLWVAQKTRKYLAKMSVKVPIASVNMLLYKVEGTGSEDWVALKETRKKSPHKRF